MSKSDGEPSLEHGHEHGPLGQYLRDLAELADVAAQAQGEGDVDTLQQIVPLLVTLARQFAEPTQIDAGVHQQAHYQTQAETLPADSVEQFIALKVSEWLTLCAQILSTGVGAETLSLKIKRVLTPERLAQLGVEAVAATETAVNLDLPQAKLERRMELALEAGMENWENFKHPIVLETIRSLSEAERAWVIAGAVRLATDVIGGLVICSKPFQGEYRDHDRRIDLQPQTKIFDDTHSFGEIYSRNDTLQDEFGPNSPYGKAFLDYLARPTDLFDIALLPVSEQPYALLYNHWPTSSYSMTNDTRHSGYETLFGIHLKRAGQAVELFNDPKNIYLLPFVIQLAGSMQAESKALYFDAAFGTHPFRDQILRRELIPGDTPRPDQVAVVNCLTKRSLFCADWNQGVPASMASHADASSTLLAERPHHFSGIPNSFLSDLNRAMGIRT